MKNYEKYADEIKNFDGVSFCDEFVKPNILKKDSCINVDCDWCDVFKTLWLLEEYEEPEYEESKVDWSKVKVDTPILVRVYEGVEWLKRYFAKYEDGKVYAWDSGRTSWNETFMIEWKYAKLAENEGSDE